VIDTLVLARRKHPGETVLISNARQQIGHMGASIVVCTLFSDRDRITFAQQFLDADQVAGKSLCGGAAQHIAPAETRQTTRSTKRLNARLDANMTEKTDVDSLGAALLDRKTRVYTFWDNQCTPSIMTMASALAE
jgi:hypothetical protein